MPCYNPIYAIRSDRFSKKGKHEIKIIGPLKISREDPKKLPLQDWELLLPCNHCIGCRLDYSRRWADRMMLELDHSKKAIFVTLTYNNRHIPFTEVDYDGQLSEFGAFTLDKRDLQLFFKRLRKRFSDKEIRYYAAGEYGSTERGERPHYHAIIFGLGLEDLGDLHLIKLNKLKQPIYRSWELDRCWSVKKQLFFDEDTEIYDPIGYVSVANVSWETCAYVSRYVQKKVYGGKSYLQDLYECAPEFSVMSRRPGIGAYFPIDHPEVFDYNILHVGDCPKDIPIPSKFIDLLMNENSSRWMHLKAIRSEYARDNLLTKLWDSDLGLYDYFDRIENEKLQKSSLLVRNEV